MKPIEIKNLNKVIGFMLKCGRVIIESGDYTDTTRDVGEYYKFVINTTANGVDAFNKQTIVLRRIPGNQYSPNESETIEKYEMFNMGLQSRTRVWLKVSEIQSIRTLVDYIDLVMHETYEFYKEKQ